MLDQRIIDQLEFCKQTKRKITFLVFCKEVIGYKNTIALNQLVKSTNFWYYYLMSKNTSISLGHYFDEFIKQRITEGRFKNASEVIRAGLRLLEEEENRSIVLKNAIQNGIDSGIAEDFNPISHLEHLKSTKKRNV